MPDGPPQRAVSDRLTLIMQRAKLTQDPLGDALVFIHEAREDFKVTAADVKAAAAGMRGISPEGERSLIDRLGAEMRGAAARLARSADTYAKWVRAGAVAGTAVLASSIGFAGGWLLCSSYPVDTYVGPMTPATARVLSINDMDRAIAAGLEVPQSRGGRARRIVVWTELPPTGG